MKRTKSKRGRRRSSTMNANKGAITGLVSSMKKNVKFKGLLKYTVGCIAELVTPPNPSISDNAHQLKKSGGIEILIQALKNHQGDEEMLAFVSSTLEKCGVDTDMIKHIAKCGAAQAVLAPLENNPNFVEGRVSAIRLVKKIAHCEETLPDLVAQGVTQSIIGVLGAASSLKNGDIDVSILTDASVTLSSLVNHEDAINSLMNEHDVGVLIGVLGSDAAKDRTIASKFLRPVFRVMQKLGSTSDGIALIKRLGGVDALLAAMEANPDDLSLLKAGASVLDKLVSVTDLEEALRILADASSSERAKQLAAAMVGNLALTGDNLETITNAGGLMSLLAVLEMAESPELIEGAARALGRLATTAANVTTLIEQGGLDRLLDILRNNVDRDGIIASVDGALTNIAHFIHGAKAIDDANGILVVVWALETHPEFDSAPNAAVKFFNMVMRTLGTRGGETLLKDNMISNVASSLVARPENSDLAMSAAVCFRTIITLLGCADKVVEAGAIETSIDALGRFCSEAGTAVPVLQLLHSLSFDAECRKRMVSGGVIAPTIRVAKNLSDNTRVNHCVTELLSRIVDLEEIKRAIQQVNDHARGVKQGRIKTEEDLDTLVLSLVHLSSYASIPKCAAWLLENNDGPKAVVQLLTSTVTARPDDVFRQGEILARVLLTAGAMAKSEKRGNVSMCALSTKVLVDVLKKFQDFPSALSEAAGLVCILARLPGNVSTLHSAGITKTLILAAKSNPSHVQLQTRTAEALSLLSINSEIANAVVRFGGAKVLLQSVADLDGQSAASARCATSVLTMVGLLADFADAHKSLSDQQIVPQLCKVVHKMGWDPIVSSAGRIPLTLLYDSSVADDFMLHSSHEIELMTTSCQYASAMCLVPSFAETHAKQSSDTFDRVVSNMAPNSSEDRCVQAGAATLGLAWLSSDVHLDQSFRSSEAELARVQILLDSLGKWNKSAVLTCRTLTAIESLANTPSTASALLQCNAPATIVAALSSSSSQDDVVALAGLRALFSLARDDAGCAAIVDAGGIQIILRELENLSNEERIAQSMLLLGRLGGCGDERVASTVLGGGGGGGGGGSQVGAAGGGGGVLPQVVTCLETFPNSSAVRSSTMASLAEITSSSSSERCRVLYSCKGMSECLTSSLDEERTDRADSVVNALRVIRDVVSSDSSDASSCKTKGVDHSILHAMTRYPTHTLLHSTAAQALFPLSTSADVQILVDTLSPKLASVRNDDQRVASGCNSQLRKLANLACITNIFSGDSNDSDHSGVDVSKVAKLLLGALEAGAFLTEEDVKGPYLGACVQAMAGLVNSDADLDPTNLSLLVAAVVQSLRNALVSSESGGVDIAATLQCATSCGLMARNQQAALLMVNEPHSVVQLAMQVLDNAGSNKYLAFAGLALLKNLATVDGQKVSDARSVETCVSLMRQHFEAFGVKLAGIDMLNEVVSSFRYTPILSEGGISMALDVLSAEGSKGGELVERDLTLLLSIVVALPANQAWLAGSDDSMSIIYKQGFLSSLSSSNYGLMAMSTQVMVGCVEGETGDPAVGRLLGMGVHEVMMRALRMHSGNVAFVVAGVALISSLLERDEGKRTIDKEEALALFGHLQEVHAESDVVTAACVGAGEKLSSTKVATDETVIEAIRTYAAYYPHLLERPDLASHLEQLSIDLSTYAKNINHAILMHADDGTEVFLSGLEVVGDVVTYDFQEREMILARSTDALGMIEKEREGYRPLTNPIAMERMMSHLRGRYDMGDLSEATLGCSVSLCANGDNCRSLHTSNGISLVLDSTKRWPERPLLQRHAASLFSCLASIPEIARDLYEQGLVELLLSQLREEEQSPELLALRLAALQTLVGVVPEAATQLVQQEEGISTVISSMWNNGSSADVVAAGMRLLESCAGEEGFSDKFAACGGVNVVLSLLSTHAYDDRVSTAASNVLEQTCTVTKDVLESMATLRSMIEAGDSTGCADALNRLASLMSVDKFHEDPELIRRVADLVKEAMRRFPDSDAVNNAGLRVLGELAKRNQELAIEFMEDDLTLNYAVDILKTDPTNISRMLPALVMLSACASSSASVATKLVNDGAMDALLNAVRMNTSNPAVQCHAVDVLGSLGKSLGGAAFLEAGGLKALLESLEVANRHNTNVLALRVLSVLDQMSLSCKEFAEAVLGSRCMELLRETMEVFSEEESVLTAVAVLMKTLAITTGKLEKLLSSELFKDLVNLMVLHPEMRDFNLACVGNGGLMSQAMSDTKLLEILAQKGAIAAVQQLSGMHADFQPMVDACDAIMEASGNADFQNLTAQEATDALRQAVASGDSSEIVKSLKNVGQLAVLDSGARGEMVEDLGTFKDVIELVGNMEPPFDMDVMQAAVGAMDQMPMNDMVVRMLLETNSIAKLLEAMRQSPNDTNLLLKVVRVLGKMSINDELKKAIVAAGGVDLVIWCMGAHQSHVLLMVACCTALANFAFNSSSVANDIVDKNGIHVVENVMQVNLNEHRVLANALQVLSNLMFKNDEHKKTICSVCGDEIVHMIRKHHSDIGVFQSGLRALGTLVYCEENVPIIVGEGACRVIVDGMRVHWEDPDTVQLAINVLENLAAENVPVQEAPDSVGREHHPMRHGEDSLQVIHAEGASHIILQAIAHFDVNPSLIMASIDALVNIVEDETLMETMIRENAVPIVMEALRSHDWDQELVSSILHLLVSMSNRSGTVAMKIEKNGGSELCGSVMDNFSSSREIVTHCCLLLTNIGNANATMATKMGQCGIVDVILSIIGQQQQDASMVLEPIHTLSILTGDKNLCKTIASKGMHSICSIAKMHMNNAELLISIHKLIGFLAFVPECLRDIVQHDGPCMIIESICNNPESREMILQAISTIDVICMSDSEHRDICVNEGAEECVQVVMETYDTDEEIVDACKSTMLSIRVNAKQQTQRRPTNISKRFSTKQQEAKSFHAEADELKKVIDKFRNKLLAGNMMTKHHKSNNPRKRHIVITQDMRMLGWKEVSMKGQFKGTLQLSEVTSIEAGPVTPSLRRRYFMGTNPKPKCCFVVHARTRTLDLECASEAQRDEWVNMLTLLLQYRKVANMQ